MMTDAELQQLRGLLTLQRHALIKTLYAAVKEERMLEPAFLRLLAHVHTAIAAVDAVLAEADIINGDT
jgi:hypothetical protein